MTSLSTDRSVNGLGRSDSTDNLLASADLSPPEVLLEPGGAQSDEHEDELGKSAMASASLASAAAQTGARPAMLTAPSFDQRPAPALGEASPWSSSETSTCRSRKNSVNLLEAWVASGIGLAPVANGAKQQQQQQTPNNNNSSGSGSNTLAIGQQAARWGDVVVRTAPPSQSSVDSAILAASGITGAQSQRNNRSVPDIELHYRRGNSDDRSAPNDASPRLYSRHVTSHHSQSFVPHSHHHHHQQHHQPNRCHPLHPQGSLSASSGCSRPRICEHQPFSFSLSRATSRESVRSAVQPLTFYGAQPESTSLRLPAGGGQLVPESGWTCPRGEMLRQHSQPESTCYHCHNPSTSLRQLKEVSAGGSGASGGCDIAGIAADTLRINGAIRQFRQVAFPVSDHSICFVASCLLALLHRSNY